jgi:hypothetical protein
MLGTWERSQLQDWGVAVTAHRSTCSARPNPGTVMHSPRCCWMLAFREKTRFCASSHRCPGQRHEPPHLMAEGACYVCGEHLLDQLADSHPNTRKGGRQKMSSTTTKITVAVSGHWLVGALRLAGTRIQEVLNDPSSDFLQLYEVEVHPPARIECLASLAKVTVPKSKIEFIGTPSRQHEAPEKSRNNHVPKVAFKAFAIVSDYYVRGELHLASDPRDYRYILVHELSTFFALTGASVGRGGSKHFSVPLLFANKSYVSCFDVGELTADKGSEPGRQASPQSEPGNLEGEMLCWQQ